MNESNKRRSQRKLLWFFAGVLVFAAALVSAGFWQRDKMRELGGNVSVTVTNDSPEKLRADVIVGPDLAVLELEPGKSGLVRFVAREKGPALLMVYRRNNLTTSIEAGEFAPEVKGEIAFRLESSTEVVVEPTKQ